MSEKLDFDAFTPLYHQLKEIIIGKIEKGDLQPGDKIPSEHSLMKQYNVSRNTVQRGIDELVLEGKLERRKGLGTFVTKPKIEQSLTSFYSFSKVLESKGMDAEDIILNVEVTEAANNVAEKLNINPKAQVIALKRLRKADGEPIILETSYLPYGLLPDFNKEELENTSLYDFLEKKYGIIVTKAKETFEPVLAREEESELLGIETGAPSLLLDRVASDNRGKVVEFCRSIVRGDRCRFYTELL